MTNIDKNTINALLEDSRQKLKSQIEVYRSITNKTGIVIGVVSLFLPIYLFIIEKSNLIIIILSIIPLSLMIFSIIKFLKVMKTKPLRRGFKIKKIESLIKYDYARYQRYKLSTNFKSILLNLEILNKQNKEYNLGITILINSIIFAIILLFINVFIK